ncbi:MAG: ribosome silencing factor [Acidimicrobiales bacterium]|jgi:ribosome-associated protein
MTAGFPNVRSATRALVPEGSLAAARAAYEKQGEDTAVLSMTDTLGVTDAFVITSGRNTRQVKTILEEVEKRLKLEADRAPLSVEGLDDFGWVLMDYGDFVVHIFLDERRSYYDLERLWADAPRVEWADGTSRASSTTSS